VNQPRWSVGALAKVAGLTVRTLHHYDELGLLRPSERTNSGHRRYTEQDLQRLYQIRLLRQLGMSLDEINDVLAEPSDPGPLREVLAGHLEQLDDQIWRLNLLRRQTRNLIDQLDGSRKPDSAGLLALLGCAGIFDDYITKEQRIFLDEHADGLGEETRQWLDTEWREVMSKLVEHYRARAPVDDPEVRRTARRLSEVAKIFAGGDPKILASVDTFFRKHGHGLLRDVLAEQQVSDLGDDLWDYVGRIHAALPAE
jgi:MerR family transcriptional regulator, thiopeptide resistance regulator